MSPLARILAIASCGAAGYFASAALATKSSRATVPARGSETAAAPLTSSAGAELKPPAESAIIAEWEQLRSKHGSGAEDFPALFLEVKELKDSFRRRAFRAALIADWAAADPQAALTFLQEKDRGLIGQLAREWLRSDPEAAVTGLLAGGEKTRGSLRGLLSDIARAAPARLAEVAAALPKSENPWDTSTLDAFAIVAQENVEAGRIAALSVSGPMRGQALAGVAKAWAEKDGAEALAWAQSMPPGEERDGVLKAALIGWAKTDPAAALDKIDLVPPGGDEGFHASDVGAQVLREAAKQDWDKTLSWLKEHPGKLGRQSFDGLQGALNERLAADVDGTMRTLKQSGMAELQQVFGNAVLNEGYAQRDRIWEWLDAQTPSEFTRESRRALLNAVAWKEPTKALEFFDKLSDTPEDQKLLESSARSLINGGSEISRLDGLLEQASPRLRPILLSLGFEQGFMGIEQGIDPQRWAGRLNELPEDRRDSAARSLSGNWARLDPEAAIAWANSLPTITQRDAALSSAVSTWSRTDPHAAAQWVNSLPAGGERDNAAVTLVGSLAQVEPESAWHWAQSIGGVHRKRALGTAYFGLHQRDPAFAREMLQSSELSDIERQWLLTEMEKVPKMPNGATQVLR